MMLLAVTQYMFHLILLVHSIIFYLHWVKAGAGVFGLASLSYTRITMGVGSLMSSHGWLGFENSFQGRSLDSVKSKYRRLVESFKEGNNHGSKSIGQ